MQKIPTIFERDWEGDRSRVLDQPVAGCEWVFEGEGNALRKYDGTCVMFDGTSWWARREVKEGKNPPTNFRLTEHDETTGKTVGWEPIEQSPFAKFHAEAVEAVRQEDSGVSFPSGTYELVGPKVQGNPEKTAQHTLIQHVFCEGVGALIRTFDGIREFLEEHDWEGIVFHHEDGRRLAKIKARDFGLKR